MIWIKKIFEKHKKNVLFYLFNFILIYVITKIWVIYILLLIYIYISVLYLIIKKESTIIIRKKSIFISYFKINIILSLSKTSINKKSINIVFFMFLFKTITGISFKIIRVSLCLFDCLYDEYHRNKVYEKKYLYVYKKYFKNCLESLIIKEFIKKIPKNKEINIENRLFKKKIKIIKANPR